MAEEKFDIRNATYNQWGTIDVEWNHPELGWIPFTASPDDVMPYGKLIHEQALAEENIAAYVAPPPPPPEPPTPDQLRIAELEARLAKLEKLTQRKDAKS